MRHIDSGYTRRAFLKTAAAAGLTLSIVGPATASDGSARYVVTCSPGTARHVARAGGRVTHELANGTVLIVEGTDGGSLQRLRGVTGVVPDFVLVAEPMVRFESVEAPATVDEAHFALQWDKQLIRSAEAHGVATGAGATIAILDSGVDLDHPEFAGRLDVARSRAFENGTVRSGYGMVAFPDGPTSLRTEYRHVADDIQGHGTHMAGIAAASRSGTTGVVGVAPDAELVSLRVFRWRITEGEHGPEVHWGGEWSNVLLAIQYAADIGADVLNMSLSLGPLPPWLKRDWHARATRQLVQYANARGSVLVTSAGNDALDPRDLRGAFVMPGEVAGVVVVSAVGPNGLRSFYSNYGTGYVTLAAPGGAYETEERTLTDEVWPFPTNLVLSTVPVELPTPLDPFNYVPFEPGFAWGAGTSMAAPQVAGAVALLRERRPDVTPQQVRNVLESTAVGTNGRSSPDLGAGVLDAKAAVDVTLPAA